MEFRNKLLRPIYHKLHFIFHATIKFNPFIKHKINGHEIVLGHIRMEQETNSMLDKHIIAELLNHQIYTQSYFINEKRFNQYLNETIYPLDYFNNEKSKSNSFIEKALEHFVSIELLKPTSEKTIIDIGAANSPFYKILASRYNVTNSYTQDLIFKDDKENFIIGGNASKLPFESNSVDGLILHCTFEHFEGTNDIDFLREAERVLKSGGKCIILPIYLASEYCINLDPICNLLKQYHPNISSDLSANFRYGNSNQHFSRHYDISTFKTRLLDKVKLEVEVLTVENYKQINHKSYLRFIAVFSKS